MLLRLKALLEGLNFSVQKTGKVKKHGAFIESECERFLYNHLNWYVFSRICWNVDTDVNAVLDEYYRLMYGPASDDIRAAFEIFERKWVDEIGGNTIDTPIGPMGNPPADVILFTKVYTPSVIDEVEACFRRAAAKAAERGAGSLEARRVDLMWREVAEPLVKRARAFHRTMVQAAPTASPKVLEKDGDECVQTFDPLEPGASYVATLDLKIENVTPSRSCAANGGSTAANGGVRIIVDDGKCGVIMHPYRNVYVDSFGWTRIALPFQASPDIPKDRKPSIKVLLTGATGKAWADNLSIRRD